MMLVIVCHVSGDMLKYEQVSVRGWRSLRKPTRSMAIGRKFNQHFKTADKVPSLSVLASVTILEGAMLPNLAVSSMSDFPYFLETSVQTAQYILGR